MWRFNIRLAGPLEVCPTRSTRKTKVNFKKSFFDKVKLVRGVVTMLEGFPFLLPSLLWH